MANANTSWTDENDQYLLEHVECSDEELAVTLKRTPYAIACRRSHQAAVIHQNDPSRSLAECAMMTHGDLVQAQKVLSGWKSKGSFYETFVSQKRKRAEPAPPPPPQDPYPGLAPAKHQRAEPMPSQPVPPPHSIHGICQAIENQAGLAPLWNDEAKLPLLIQFYPGFRAYAEHLFHL